MDIVFAAVVWLLVAPMLALLVGRCIRSMNDQVPVSPSRPAHHPRQRYASSGADAH